MTVIQTDILGKVVVARAPPWSRKGTVIKNYPSSAQNPSDLQLRARVAFARAAHAAFGTKGKINGMPAVCQAIKANYSSPGTYAQAQQRAESKRQIAHQAAAANIQAMEARAGAMGQGMEITPAGGSYPF